MPKASRSSGQLPIFYSRVHIQNHQQAPCNFVCSGDGFKRAVAQIQRWGRWIGEGSRQCLSLDYHAWEAIKWRATTPARP